MSLTERIRKETFKRWLRKSVQEIRGHWTTKKKDLWLWKDYGVLNKNRDQKNKNLSPEKEERSEKR